MEDEDIHHQQIGIAVTVGAAAAVEFPGVLTIAVCIIFYL